LAHLENPGIARGEESTMARKKPHKRVAGEQDEQHPAPPRWVDADSAFLRIIRTEHDSDTPRLVYADWLDEQGDPDRAEFIRVQCELAGLDQDGERARGLKAREAELLGEHCQRWTYGLSRFKPHLSYTFRRGFVEELECASSRSCPEVLDLLRHHAVRKLRLQGGPLAYCQLSREECRQLAECPDLAFIRELDCPTADDAESLHLLLSSPHLSGLETLRLKLSRSALEPQRREAMAALAAAPLLARLPRLDLSENYIGPEALSALLAAPQFGARELSLRGEFQPEHDGSLYYSPAGVFACVGSDGIIRLSRAPAVSSLRCLDLVYNHLDVPAIEALLESPHLDGVTRLVVGEFDALHLEAHRSALGKRFGYRLDIRPFPCAPVW
jgi:uncharacterized protein (TIGR02996 family)